MKGLYTKIVLDADLTKTSDAEKSVNMEVHVQDSVLSSSMTFCYELVETM